MSFPIAFIIHASQSGTRFDVQRGTYRHSSQFPTYRKDGPESMMEDRVAKHSPRKRAPRACLSCRKRKVRCDVAQRGPPCMNCFLDKEDCIVKPRSTKYRLSGKYSAANSGGHSNFHTNTDLETSPTNSQFHSCPSLGHGETLSESSEPVTQDMQADGDNSSDNSGEETERAHSGDARGFNGEVPIMSPVQDFGEKSVIGCTSPANFESSPAEKVSESRSIFSTHVTFSYYSFLDLNSMSQLSPEDIKFLESQGCFRVPTKPILDEFVQEYFLHIHPCLPLIDEGAFWEMYQSPDNLSEPRLSLFVFQAMLFASCVFLPTATIQKLGFTNTRSARTSYYKRAKLIFDFDGERQTTSIAQGALLLSYHSPTRSIKKINTFWLGLSIQSAKDADAHRYHVLRNLSEERRNTLKRLWWCCILRDRILPLGVRRSLHITSTDFDFKQTTLTQEDLESEIGRSRVYDASTKRSIAQLLEMLCELAVALTDVITLVYPSSDCTNSSTPAERMAEMALKRTEACKLDLTRWFEKASVIFPTPAGLGDGHESLILYTNLLYMYYHSAMIALYNHEVLISATSFTPARISKIQMRQSKFKLEEATAGVTENLKELVQLKLAKYLPISVVAYAVLPLLLHLLNVKLSNTPFQCAIKQRRLSIFTAAMEALQTQYDGTDYVSDVITRMVECISLESPTQRSREHTVVENSEADSGPLNEKSSVDVPTVNDWGDVFLRQPTLYLRLVLTVDHSLSRVRFPDDVDFPLALQSKSKSETAFPPYRISMNGSEPAIPIADSNHSQTADIPMDATETSSSDSLNSSYSNNADDSTLPMIMDSFDFEPTGFELPMGFEAFDLDMSSKRGFGFDYLAAWNDDSGMFPETCEGLS